ncbi:hypothetical protein [Pseudomonas sp.]|uniref:hypothetical protein n=1 Tax=Pseudomonas sp. TaxID=306 RepID=UPI0028AC98B9|nr:hypothetical protein [Pseudomonas sp.]
MSIVTAKDKNDYIKPISSGGVVVVELFKDSGKASPAVSAYLEQWSAHADPAITFVRVPLALAQADADTFKVSVERPASSSSAAGEKPTFALSAPTVLYFKNGKCVKEELGSYANDNYTKGADPARGWYELKLAEVMRG